jgi:hypothetical protein
MDFPLLLFRLQMDPNQRCNTQQENTFEHSRRHALRDHVASYYLHMKPDEQLHELAERLVEEDRQEHQ